MLEFDVDMAYCEEAEYLDLVVLNDENGEMGAREFVPKAKAPADTSDGWHTFDELYEHRTALLMALCNLRACILDSRGYLDATGRYVFKSRQHHDGEMYDGMFIVGINCARVGEPDEWATWHCEDEWWDRFVVPELDRAPKWDGHTPKDALERLLHAYAPREEQ